MFDVLVIGYLFLGGTGAAVILLSCCIDLRLTKEPFGVATETSLDAVSPCTRIVWFGMLIGFLALAVGVLCLVFDLGRSDRIDYLFQYPSLSWLTIGSFALFALLLCSGFLALVRFLYLPFVQRNLVVVFEITTILIAAIVIVYTGLLLQGFGSVAFWNTPLLPILFVLSSLSAGFAVLFLVAFFGERDQKSDTLLRRIKKADLAVIVSEFVVAAFLMYFSLNSTRPAEINSAQQLFFGEAAPVWWGGFALCGILLPSILGVAVSRVDCSKAFCLALAGVLILLGAFSLRRGIVDAGTHPGLELEEATGFVLEDAEALNM